MPTETTIKNPRTDDSTASNSGRMVVTDESLVLRNYDSAPTPELTVQFTDDSGKTVFERTYSLHAREAVSVSTRLRRAVYRVTVTVDGEKRASVDCLIGSGLDETALVEIGNGLTSASEGVR